MFLSAIQPQLRSLSKYLTKSGVEPLPLPPAVPSSSPATPRQAVVRQMSAPEVRPLQLPATPSTPARETVAAREPKQEEVDTQEEEEPSSCVVS